MAKRKNVYRLELVEPTFVLRASDPFAQSLIKQWARRHDLARAKGWNNMAASVEETARARQLTVDMETWAQGDAVRRYHEVMNKFTKRFPGGRTSGEVIKLRPPK